MGSLFGSLIATAGSLRAYDKSLSVIQNNVANADTPGFARQRAQMFPKPFDIRSGLAGGVETRGLTSSRDEYSERNVWRQTSVYGRLSQQTADLEQIEPFFQVTEGAGVPAELNKFFNAVSSLSINPNDPVARQLVLDRAASTARAFNANANALGEATGAADIQMRHLVDRVNALASTIRDINIERRSDRRKLEDPALDAKLHQTLEDLSEVAAFNVVSEADGSVQLLLGGQTPLVIGDRQMKIRADFTMPQPRLLDENDVDVTGQLTDGELMGLTETRNTLIPKYMADLNQLARTFADRVNEVLSQGVDQANVTPQMDLFTYDDTVGAAVTLKTNPLDPSQLAAAESGFPGGNGNVLRLANLSQSQEIDGVTFTEFYGELGSKVGRDLTQARGGMQVQEQLVNQARTLRADRSGVSLDEEAARLVEAQRAYQANAQLFSVLNSLTDTLLGLLH